MKKSILVLSFVALFVLAGGIYRLRLSTPGKYFRASPPDLLLVRLTGNVSNVGGNYLLTSRKGLNYLLTGEAASELKKYLNKDTEVLGAIKFSNPASIDGKRVECTIDVIASGNELLPIGSPLSEDVLVSFQQKVDKKRQLRLKILEKVNVKGPFDAIEGFVYSEMREVPGKGKVKHMLLKTEDSDVYLLPGLIENNDGKLIIALGRESLPEKGYVLKEGEITFKVQQVQYEEPPPHK